MKIEPQRVFRLEEEIEKKVRFIQIECAVDGKALYGTRQTALFLFIEINRSVSKEIIETRPETSGFGGAAWQEKQTLIVPDVDAFPGHIACSSLSRSEIVVPLLKDGEVWGVLDIDSEQLSTFDETDRKYLEELCTYF